MQRTAASPARSTSGGGNLKPSGPRSHLSMALAFALCLASPAAPLSSQTPAAPPPAGDTGATGDRGETFFESIDVEVVNVEVYVTGRDGRPVTGLSREDFQLFEDGKPVTVTNFYAVPGTGAEDTAAAPAAGEAAPAAAGEAATGPAPAPAATATAPATPTIPEEQRLHLAVFVDDRSLGPAGRNVVLKRIREFLAGRPQGRDRLLLVRYDGSLQVRQAPTDDPLALSTALEQVARGVGRGAHETAEMQRILAELDQASTPEEGRAVLSTIEAFAERRQDDIRATLGAASELVDELAGLPGRKALLCVSGGLPLEPGEALLRAYQAKFGGPISPLANQFETRRLLTRLAERANANRVTFYALGAIESISGISAAHRYSSIWTEQNLEAVERDNRAASLLDLAADTGGLASLDGGTAAKILERVAGDLDRYYSLGFTPAHARDGKLHRLEVKVRDRSLTVRHREAYRANSTVEAMQGRTLAALALGGGSNPLAVALDLGPEKDAGKGQVAVQVLVRFRLSDVALVPRDAFHEGHLRLFIAARDERGGTSPVSEIDVPLRIPKEKLREALGKPAGYVTTLKLRRGPHRVVVTLLDELAKVSSTVTARYPSPAGAAAGAAGTRMP
jgi:VWFA-related protein